MPSSTSAETTAPDDAAADSGVNPRYAALHSRNYRLFFFGQLISVTGMWMQSLAMSWLLVRTLHASASELGLLQVFQFGPVLILGIPAGIVADRYPKRTILFITQSIYMAGAALLTWLVATNRIELWHVYAISTVSGITNSLDMPTRQAIVSELVPQSALKNAIALNAAMFNLGRILGPSVAGVILARWGTEACFGINAVSYLGPITGYILMRLTPVKAVIDGSPFDRIKEGLAYIRRTPAVIYPTALVAIVATAGMNYNVWLPLVATDSLDADEKTYGFMFAMMGVGSLAGALTVAFSKDTPTIRRTVLAALLMGTVTIAVAAIASIPLSVPIVTATLALLGFCTPNIMASANTIVQTNSPPELRGRVMAVYSTMFLGTAPIGGLISGFVTDKIGVELSMAIGGSIAVATALYFLLVLLRRHNATTAGSAA